MAWFSTSDRKIRFMPKIRRQATGTKGEIRIRSNVCTDPNAWQLVPGDMIRAYNLPDHHMTPRQNQEMMYYERCCLCRRTVYELMEEGCNYCAEQGHGVPSVAEARRCRENLRRNQDERDGRSAFE